MEEVEIMIPQQFSFVNPLPVQTDKNLTLVGVAAPTRVKARLVITSLRPLVYSYSPSVPPPIWTGSLDFRCVACGSVQSVANLIDTAAGETSACLMCLRCSVLLRVTLSAEEGVERVVCERESVYAGRMRRLERDVVDGGC